MTAEETGQNSAPAVSDTGTQSRPAGAAGEVLTPLNFPSHMNVKFVTRNDKYRVPETPFKVPSDLTRFGLSEIVNHLLGQDPPVPFEFLVEYRENKKAFLRMSLKKFFIKAQKWPETVMELEYTEAQPAPKCVDTIPHDDWVSAIDHCYLPDGAGSVPEIVFTGCYDGLVRVIDPSTGTVLSGAKHRNPVRAVAVACRAIGTAGADGDSPHRNDVLFCTATRDESVRVWKYDPQRQQCQLQIALQGHSDAVDCLALNRTHSMLVSGSLDRTLKIWELEAFRESISMFDDNSSSNSSDENESEGADEISGPARKKQKMLKQSLVGTLSGHYLGITCVSWGASGVIYSGSSDHTIRLWDIVKGTTKRTLNGSKVPVSLSVNEDIGAVLSAHPDFLVRMWDPRMDTPRASLFRSHKGWVRSVEWSPTNPYQFISGGDDNLIKLWDIRSSVPLHSVSHHVVEPQNAEDMSAMALSAIDDPTIDRSKLTRMARKQKVENHKVLAVKWKTPEHHQPPAAGESNAAVLYSGSTDCTLKKHSYAQ